MPARPPARLSAPEQEALVARQSSISPLGRVADVADVADVAGAIAFLLSDRAGFISGEVLHVAGGGQLAPVVGSPA